MVSHTEHVPDEYLVEWTYWMLRYLQMFPEFRIAAYSSIDTAHRVVPDLQADPVKDEPDNDDMTLDEKG